MSLNVVHGVNICSVKFPPWASFSFCRLRSSKTHFQNEIGLVTAPAAYFMHIQCDRRAEGQKASVYEITPATKGGLLGKATV